MDDVALPHTLCSALVPQDFGLKVLLCASVDGTQGEASFLPIVAWVTLTEPANGDGDLPTWSWQPVATGEPWQRTSSARSPSAWSSRVSSLHGTSAGRTARSGRTIRFRSGSALSLEALQSGAVGLAWAEAPPRC